MGWLPTRTAETKSRPLAGTVRFPPASCASTSTTRRGGFPICWIEKTGAAKLVLSDTVSTPGWWLSSTPIPVRGASLGRLRCSGLLAVSAGLLSESVSLFASIVIVSGGRRGRTAVSDSGTVFARSTIGSAELDAAGTESAMARRAAFAAICNRCDFMVGLRCRGRLSTSCRPRAPTLFATPCKVLPTSAKLKP